MNLITQFNPIISHPIQCIAHSVDVSVDLRPEYLQSSALCQLAGSSCPCGMPVHLAPTSWVPVTFISTFVGTLWGPRLLQSFEAYSL